MHLEAGGKRRHSLIKSVGVHLLQREIIPHIGEIICSLAGNS